MRKRDTKEADKGSVANPSDVEHKDYALALGREKVLQMYEQMHVIRSFERRSEQMYQQKKIGGFLHVYIGQEAVGVGFLNAINDDDHVVTSYRDHAFPIIRGVPLGVLMAELFGKATGLCKGKGGSMHFYSREKNLLGGHGIVGGQIPIGLGAAFRNKYLGTKQLSLVLLGDGAVNQGVFHEALNMASLWNLPAIFIIENNLYGMGTSIDRSTADDDVALRAAAYSMEGLKVDGMDLLACHRLMSSIAKDVRKASRPVLIEAETYRYRGHSISDPANYRGKKEVEQYIKNDPIINLKTTCQRLKWLSEDEDQAIQDRVNKQVKAAVDFADKSPQPSLESLSEDVLAN